MSTSSFFRSILVMAIISTCVCIRADEPIAQPKLVEAIMGLWRIDFHPNRARRTYVISKDGTVISIEPLGWKASLKTAPLPSAKSTFQREKGECISEQITHSRNTSRWQLRFDEDAAGCYEVITLCSDGRLLIEHFNPTATALPAPDQIGIGVRVEVKREMELSERKVQCE